MWKGSGLWDQQESEVVLLHLHRNHCASFRSEVKRKLQRGCLSGRGGRKVLENEKIKGKDSLRPYFACAQMHGLETRGGNFRKGGGKRNSGAVLDLKLGG